MVYAADLDSCLMLIRTTELIRVFPSLQMASPVNCPVMIKELKECICVADFGYKVFISWPTMDTKLKVARRFRDLGITINFHESLNVFTTSRIPVGQHILARALMGGGIQSVLLCAYGMKIPLGEEVQGLSMTRKSPINPQPNLTSG